MTVFEAAAKVRDHFQKNIPANVVHYQGVYVVENKPDGEILKFPGLARAYESMFGGVTNDLPRPEPGYIFKCTYRNGEIEIEPC